MRATTNLFVVHATTTRLHTMAVGVGGGRVKSLGLWGARPAGQSCTFTREIREGGV